MGDIGSRIRRYRLSRYAPPQDSLMRRLRWVWPLLLIWIVYAGFLSDHSLMRIWQLRQEMRHTQRELDTARAEIERLDQEKRDPAARRTLAEKALRERSGWARRGEIVYRIQGDGADSIDVEH
jgi:cell division protein FtsB